MSTALKELDILTTKDCQSIFPSLVCRHLTVSKDSYEGINGVTAWILVVDYYTGMLYGNTRTSKAAPVLWLKHFLAQYNPSFRDKCVLMDQGGELFNNPEVKNLFTKSGYAIHPTGADASNQNGPVERAHHTIADTIWAILAGSRIDTKFWPFAFYHTLQLRNALPTQGQLESPLTKSTGITEDYTNLRTFGCQVWA